MPARLRDDIIFLTGQLLRLYPSFRVCTKHFLPAIFTASRERAVRLHNLNLNQLLYLVNLIRYYYYLLLLLLLLSAITINRSQ